MGSEGEYGKYAALVSVLVGQLIGPLDGSMVNVALPTIGEELHISISATSWIMVTYFLITAGFLVSFGRLGDLLGRKRVFCSGLALFASGAVVSGLSPNYGALILGRALQAVGAGMFTATLPALVTLVFPPAERGKALGFAATAVSLALAAGPFLGGSISGGWGWRFIFFVTPPLALLSLFLTLRLVPESHAREGAGMDLPGTLLLLSIFAPLVLLLIQGRSWGWNSIPVRVCAVLSIASVLIFVHHERRSPAPVVELKLFRLPSFTLSNLASYAGYIAFQAALFTTPFFLQYYLGLSPGAVGLVLTVTNTVSLFFLSPSGILSDRIGQLPLETAGMLFIALSLGMLSLLGAELTLTVIILSLAALGVGYGLFRSPNYSAVMGSVPRERLGVAGGVYATMRTFGFLSGIAAASWAMGSWALRKPVTPQAVITDPSFQSAVRNAYLAGLSAALAGILILLAKAAFDRKRESQGSGPDRRNTGA